MAEELQELSQLTMHPMTQPVKDDSINHHFLKKALHWFLFGSGESGSGTFYKGLFDGPINTPPLVFGSDDVTSGDNYWHGVWGMGYGIWDMGYETWGMGYGVWGVGYEICGMGYGVWDEICGMEYGVLDMGYGI